MRLCNECGKDFASGNSYRVHKHRFHRPKPAATQESQSVEPKLEPTHALVPVAEQEDHKEVELWSGGDDLGGVIAIGAAIVVGVLLLLFGKKQ